MEKEEQKPQRKKYGARQNFVRSSRVNEMNTVFTDILEAYGKSGLKSLSKMKKEEVDSDTFEKEMKDQKEKFDGKKKGADVAKASVQAVKNEEFCLEDFSLEEIENFMLSEEFQQLDELSRNTLSNYVAGVAKEKGARIGNRQQGLKTAIKKLKTRKMKEEYIELDEAKRIISKHGDGVHTAKVYRDAENNEYQVHFFKNGKHMGEDPVSYHDDKDDAQGTAEHEVKRMNAKVNEDYEQIDERELSDAEMKKREDYVKGMKKKLSSFKAKYGDRAKEVMYATATKMAKKD